MLNKDLVGNHSRSHKHVNLEIKTEAEVIRVLGGEDGDEITALHFGPYDNGYILVGLSNGKLIVYDPITLNRVNQFSVFTQG